MTSSGLKAGSGMNDLLIYNSSQESHATSKGSLYPAKVAFSLGMGKLLLGLLLLVFGVLALLQGSSQAYLGGGLWGGVCVIVSGTLGIMSSRRPCTYFYLASFMAMSIVSLAVSGLVVIFSTIGLIRDDASSRAVFVNTETGEPLAFLGDVVIRRPAVIFSAVLLGLAVLDILLSLFAIAICSREVCAASSAAGGTRPVGPGGTERLWRWLGQQRRQGVYVQQVPPPGSQLTSVPAWLPVPAPVLPPGAVLARPPTAASAYRPASELTADGAQVVYIDGARVAVHQHQQDLESGHGRRERRRLRRKTAAAEAAAASGPSDEEIASSYTGLDREIAEQFISASMEPGLTLQRNARLQEISDSLHSSL
ncbi:uncharacterized protein LOC122363212 [Amphibalanus amphitrite]|uniref:uncharacterized protein LOC122363212 n=1 Tax=Amphibalanus amphitrite TaxID=1232801 RepID=UPI001C913990|nr:uncharacterized protein LOC122363212 [Amphibalanus amphitrite]XP_043188143.1 uncharacterized protein LOC122363212 [Amphibalanus amphitrite]